MREKFYNPHAEVNYGEVLKQIQGNVRNYLVSNNIKTLVIGISGGIDSCLNAAILSPICKEMGIEFIGRYIHIESNTKEEMERAELIGNTFCPNNFKVKKLDSLYEFLLSHLEEVGIFGGFNIISKTVKQKIRRGNVKARLRAMWLSNIAHEKGGLVVDNDNMTEYLLGFYTLNCSGDISPLFSLLKTEVFELAKYYASILEDENEKKALQCAIDAVPTDGLGITSSDVEQFGANSYDEVDDILVHYINGNGYSDVMNTYLIPKYGKEVVDNVINRYLRTAFKRNHPYRVIL